MEDNADIRVMTERLLKTIGCEVLLVADGPSGIEAVNEHCPDVAIIDIGLPEPDWLRGGPPESLARWENCRGLGLIAMTGFGQPEDRRKVLDAGFDDHLVKPVDLCDLSALLSRLARQSA